MFEKARRIHREDVVNNGMPYTRFVKDFYHGNRHIDCTNPTCKNIHSVILNIVHEVLLNHKDLKVVQETARERVSRLEGQVQSVLVEEMNEHDNSFVTGRMSNNTIVHFPGDVSLIGKIVDVKLKECHGFYYIGELV